MAMCLGNRNDAMDEIDTSALQYLDVIDTSAFQYLSLSAENC